MWKRTGRVFLAAAATLTISLGTAQALATTQPPPWTVTPNPASFTAPLRVSWTLTDTTSTSAITCTTGALGGTAMSSANDTIGSITSSHQGGCTGPSSVSFTVIGRHLNWTLRATSISASNIVSGTFTGVKFRLSATSTGCTAVVEAAPLASGYLKYNYSDNDYYLKIIPAVTTLEFQSVSAGCGSLFANNDPAEIVATYGPFSPTTTIT